ncbi:DUF2127 domain-containing protein [Acidimangrovimonas sediminis]|uniref:DUF2127 domain-containing protein n=1 Tax=Acidimangrovimonas sediminis TaxID=2056283 RepID=UPI001304D9E7|nr:DUF2127 domain-containing protein [Acidimangrovimonas sediminis]
MPAGHLDRLARWLHGSYLFGLGMQALIGSVQFVAALVLIGAQMTDEMAELAHWTSRMMATQTPDPLAARALRALHEFSVHPHTFWSVYLLGHGILNLGVVVALLARKHWAYPASILVLVAFIVYQMWDFSLTHAPVLILLSLFDLAVIGLVWREWREVRERGAER